MTTVTAKKQPTGFVLYEGKSVLDGMPIVVVATLSTTNEKTGNMVQTWILRSDVAPNEAVKTGQDESVCGGCVHRHYLGGSCYVLPFQAPLNIYKSYKKGNYPKLTAEYMWMLAGRDIRLGAYGDPAAVPYYVWKGVVSVANSRTGYTHQANHPDFDARILEFCMVSADTPKQAAKFHKQGLRTFRVKTPEAPLLAGEVECLADTKGLTCQECKLCSGASVRGAAVAINVHGQRSKRYAEKYGKVNMIPMVSIA